MEKVSVACAMEWSIKLRQGSKEPEPAVSKLVKVAVVRVCMSMFKLSRGKDISECATWFLSKARICMKLLLLEESSNEENLVPFLVSLTKLASRSTHLASELVEVIMPFLGEDKTTHVRAAVLRCLHFLTKRGMCFSLVHESETAKFSYLNKKSSHRICNLKARQVFQKDTCLQTMHG
ncbi:hypothetical protein F2Q68_00034361 [Brassica cretica]|uniref:Uncharacterized protein n=1 Tax=Brassica cretica TaxID=69181 RepID=A0A8S9GZZ9_BRACR|nr:hypothetical protein F2Q68_00034361 [Brassica cretica]